jgi:hypothetical protein
MSAWRTAARIVGAVVAGAVLTGILEVVAIAGLLLYVERLEARVGPDGMGLTGVAVFGVFFTVAAVGWPLLSICSYVFLHRRAKHQERE